MTTTITMTPRQTEIAVAFWGAVAADGDIDARIDAVLDKVPDAAADEIVAALDAQRDLAAERAGLLRARIRSWGIAGVWLGHNLSEETPADDEIPF